MSYSIIFVTVESVDYSVRLLKKRDARHEGEKSNIALTSS